MRTQSKVALKGPLEIFILNSCSTDESTKLSFLLMDGVKRLSNNFFVDDDEMRKISKKDGQISNWLSSGKEE